MKPTLEQWYLSRWSIGDAFQSLYSSYCYYHFEASSYRRLVPFWQNSQERAAFYIALKRVAKQTCATVHSIIVDSGEWWSLPIEARVLSHGAATPNREGGGVVGTDQPIAAPIGAVPSYPSTSSGACSCGPRQGSKTSLLLRQAGDYDSSALAHQGGNISTWVPRQPADTASGERGSIIFGWTNSRVVHTSEGRVGHSRLPGKTIGTPIWTLQSLPSTTLSTHRLVTVPCI
jgi:hypothetical protein